MRMRGSSDRRRLKRLATRSGRAKEEERDVEEEGEEEAGEGEGAGRHLGQTGGHLTTLSAHSKASRDQ